MANVACIAVKVNDGWRIRCIVPCVSQQNKIEENSIFGFDEDVFMWYTGRHGNIKA